MSRHAPEVADLGNGLFCVLVDYNMRFLVEYLTRQTQGILSEFTILDGEKTLCEGPASQSQWGQGSSCKESPRVRRKTEASRVDSLDRSDCGACTAPVSRG